MTAHQYRAALASLGLTRLVAAQWLGVDEKTIRRWGHPKGKGPPKRVAMLLELAIIKSEHDADAKRATLQAFEAHLKRILDR